MSALKVFAERTSGILLFASSSLLFSCEGSNSAGGDGDEGPSGCTYPQHLGLCICDDTPPSVEGVPECSVATMGEPIVCCDDGTTCSCGRIECIATPDFCACSSPGNGPTALTSCTGTVCCAVEGRMCFCGATACSSDSVQVPSCSAETIICNADETRVEKCVFR